MNYWWRWMEIYLNYFPLIAHLGLCWVNFGRFKRDLRRNKTERDDYKELCVKATNLFNDFLCTHSPLSVERRIISSFVDNLKWWKLSLIIVCARWSAHYWSTMSDVIYNSHRSTVYRSLTFCLAWVDWHSIKATKTTWKNLEEVDSSSSLFACS